PMIGAVAARGDLSSDQLTQVVKVAEPADERRWATEAASWSPADLAQQARLKRAPTVEEADARRAARELRLWWRRDQGMLDGRFAIPDIDGDLVERVFNRMIDDMKPRKGSPWESREHRAADALVELCRNFADVDCPTHAAPLFIVEVPEQGPATVAGIPLPEAMVERLRGQAKI